MKADLLIAYIDGELTQEEEQQVELELRDNSEYRRVLSKLCYQKFLYAEARQTRNAGNIDLPPLVQKTFKPQKEPERLHVSKASWGLIAASFLIFFFVLFYPQSSSQSSKGVKIASIRKTTDGVEIIRDDKKMVAVQDMDILSNDTVLTHRDNSVTLRYIDGSSLKLYPKSILVLPHTTSTKDVSHLTDKTLLKTGKLYANIKHQPSDQPIYFLTGDSEVEVVGTKFSLNTHSRRGTILKMLDGKVRFTKTSTQTTIDVTKSQWAYTYDKIPFTTQKGTSNLFKDGDVLWNRAFDSQFKSWVFPKSKGKLIVSEQKSPIGITLQEKGNKMSCASVKIPSVETTSFKSMAIEFENMNESTYFVFGLSKDSKKIEISDVSEPYGGKLNFKNNRWYSFRLELDASESPEGKPLIHVTGYRDGVFFVDSWKEVVPNELQFNFTGGQIHLKNLRVIELVPEEIE
jgi:hypothetical protein